MELNENVIEWINGDKKAGLTFSQKKYINKIKRYADSNSDVEILADNEDGSIYAKIPLTWIKISPPRKGREYTEEERTAAIERLRQSREKRNGKSNISN